MEGALSGSQKGLTKDVALNLSQSFSSLSAGYSEIDIRHLILKHLLNKYWWIARAQGVHQGP